jgi:hypothetical protein
VQTPLGACRGPTHLQVRQVQRFYEDYQMTKEEALQAIKLLSALESWAFSTKNILPDYLHDDLCETQNVLEKIVLEEK